MQSQIDFHWDALYNINRSKYKKVCASLSFVKFTFDRMVIAIYEICNVSLFAMLLD